MPIKQADIELFCEILQSEFKLKFIPKIQVEKITYFSFACFGLYEGRITKKRTKHIITIDPQHVRSKKQLFATLAHEYVHAWQCEENLAVKHNKKTKFVAWQDYFQVKYNIDIVGMN